MSIASFSSSNDPKSWDLVNFQARTSLRVRKVQAVNMPPIIFLDVDDVICINAPYGGYDVVAPDRPADLWEKLFHPAAVDTLLTILSEHRPHVVLTTSWLRMMDREGFEVLFRRTGLDELSRALHPKAWEAPQARGETRLEAIEKWLAANRKDEPFVILDDPLSGTGLIDSSLFNNGRVVLCELSVGLTADHLAIVRRALGR
ncbi:HAD domain-containing protein [Variovorax sp. J22R115]|uniref:HAD domain-containing protein n=1 Tax=Variovorax sp. J22R115 TaxID=3053509 RepID=UPI002576D759|nr:HAD domain-containing protein [Variovorax sp. J22R115]MDM0054028.1 HAD domain-containing protein [Variovorax sp. J22R115]